MRLRISYQAFAACCACRQINALDEGAFSPCSDHALAFLPRITLRRAA
jgi:hypothetical protein